MKKKQQKNLLVNAAICKSCKTVLFSRASHDYRSCTCGRISVDGGFDYFRCCVTEQDIIEYLNVKLPKKITKKILYNDWNYNIDKYGLYKRDEYPSYIKKLFKSK